MQQAEMIVRSRKLPAIDVIHADLCGVHISRQQGQSLLNVSQEFRLKAGPDFLQL
jgi:hypothetical protein